MWAGNFSVGVNLLFALTRRALRHPRRAITTPRSSRCTIASRRTPRAARPRACSRSSSRSESSLPSALRHGREGITGRAHQHRGRHPRAARRRRRRRSHGDVCGARRAAGAYAQGQSDRGIFARGALRAAQWVVTLRNPACTTCRMCSASNRTGMIPPHAPHHSPGSRSIQAR